MMQAFEIIQAAKDAGAGRRLAVAMLKEVCPGMSTERAHELLDKERFPKELSLVSVETARQPH